MGMKQIIWNMGATGTVDSPVLLAGKYYLSISGAFVATIKWQRSYDNGSTWHVVQSYTAPAEQIGEDPEGAMYRPWCSAYTSGAIVVSVGQ